MKIGTFKMLFSDIYELVRCTQVYSGWFCDTDKNRENPVSGGSTYNMNIGFNYVPYLKEKLNNNFK